MPAGIAGHPRGRLAALAALTAAASAAAAAAAYVPASPWLTLAGVAASAAALLTAAVERLTITEQPCADTEQAQFRRSPGLPGEFRGVAV